MNIDILINIEVIVFYVFSALLVAAALMVILAKNPVHGVLFLIFSFFATSVLWMLLQAEFLALALIFVYVGAVMTLFLFVVMMLSIKTEKIQLKSLPYVVVALFAMAILTGILLYLLHTQYFDAARYQQFVTMPADYSNVKALGEILYTQYAYAFEVAGVILLVAILSAIGLAFRGRKKDNKLQLTTRQLAANKANRLQIVKQL